MTMGNLLELAAPSVNAALLRGVSPTGLHWDSKASGAIIAVRDDLYLLTNRHVVTGRRWMTSAEAEKWSATNPGETPWLPEFDKVSPAALDVQVPLSGKLYTLARLQLDGPEDPNDSLCGVKAWEAAPGSLMRPDLTEPQDLVCLHLSKRSDQWSAVISQIAHHRIALGYPEHEIGLGYEAQLGDRVFVVGYPLQIGLDPTDPPVWTGGTIATPPGREWNGDRFLIDARTRSGQSGSAVIAYAPAQGGLPPRHHLLGIYSGRLRDDADLGSVWTLDFLIDELWHGRWAPRPRILHPTLDDDNFVLKTLDDGDD